MTRVPDIARRKSQLYIVDALMTLRSMGNSRPESLVWEREFQLASNRAIPRWVEGLHAVRNSHLSPIHVEVLQHHTSRSHAGTAKSPSYHDRAFDRLPDRSKRKEANEVLESDTATAEFAKIAPSSGARARRSLPAVE